MGSKWDHSLRVSWITLRARETVASGRELVGGNGMISNNLVAKRMPDTSNAMGFSFRCGFWVFFIWRLVRLQKIHFLILQTRYGPTNGVWMEKVVPASRPNTDDSYNDETFGDSESMSQDRQEVGVSI
ncbi:hypothetical protein QVD17_35668 [Tagetes erecta]|uniref:Uncharacterized protein n=1 Tax=Tagetes erecta TaxID=13708 RepID=A0AAD8NIF7_TARER|nr:hypothetical protein QVD17_35668 [Tagetes erecta]